MVASKISKEGYIQEKSLFRTGGERSGGRMAGSSVKDWIGVVETAYVLDGDTKHWLERLADTVEPILDMGLGLGITYGRPVPPDLGLEYFVARGPHQHRMESGISPFVSSISWPVFERMLNYHSPARTLSELVYPVQPSHAQVVEQITPDHPADILVVVCNSGGDGGVAMLSALLLEPRRLGRVERRQLNRLAAHLSSGLRLRSHLADLDLDDGKRTEAILKPDGKLLEARGPATPKSARERLRKAVVQSERARGPLRRDDPDEALALWEALVKGRWSLVDHFDSDGSRMVVAVENEPGVQDPRGLTPMQLRIAESLGQGRTAKEIGYAYGISVSAVNNAIAGVRTKLGLSSRAEVASFFSPFGVRAHLLKLDIGQDTLLVGEYGGCELGALSELTEAEREVALMVLQGATNDVIALRRSVSYNTVANQIKSLYAKLDVSNRAELAATVSMSMANEGQLEGLPPRIQSKQTAGEEPALGRRAC